MMRGTSNSSCLAGGYRQPKCSTISRQRSRHRLHMLHQQLPWRINIVLILLSCFTILLLPYQSMAMMVNMSSFFQKGNKNSKNESTSSISKTTISVINLQLPPSSRFQKIEGYIHGDDNSGGGSSYIDISDLTFTIGAATVNTTTASATSTATTESSQEDILYFLDLALLYVPDKCHETPEGCDLAKDLGIGVPSSSNSGKANSWYCCTHDARIDNACDNDNNATSDPDHGHYTSTNFGRLILNHDLFHGETRNIVISSSAQHNEPMEQEIRHFVGSDANFFVKDGAGEYAIILANCNVKSRPVVVNGTVTFVSSFIAPIGTGGDNVPSSLQQQDNSQQDVVWQQQDELDLLFPTLAVIYFLLLLWFVRLYIKHMSSRIALEKWILITIIMGFCEMILRSLSLFIWQYSEYRHNQHYDDEMTGQVPNTASAGDSDLASAAAWLALVAVICGSCKHGIGRSLFLMLALGWGIVRAELRKCTMILIVIMTTMYIVCDAAFDIVNYFVSYKYPDYQITQRLGNALLIGIIIRTIVEVTFTIWIPIALCRTMSFLKKTKQGQKLERFRLLLYILLGAVTMTTLTLILYLVLGPSSSGGSNSAISSLGMGNEVNFVLILLFVSIVWRPNPNARDYAYVMQLSTIGAPDDYDDEDNDGIMLDDLDLSGNAKSSATEATVAKSNHDIT